MSKLILVNRTTGLRTGLCDNCGEAGVLDADRHCVRCAELAHEAHQISRRRRKRSRKNVATRRKGKKYSEIAAPRPTLPDRIPT